MIYETPVVLSHNRKACAAVDAGTFPRAGKILSAYLTKITGAVFAEPKETEDLPSLILKMPDIVWESRNPDGFSYEIRGGNVVFEALNEQGAVYAVYDFLEKICGCRFYTSREEDVPFDANLTVDFHPVHMEPQMAYREVYYKDYTHREFAEKHKMTAGEAKNDVWGFWCHSFGTLLPPDEYFEKHPEYFALRDGKRVPDQPCLSHPDVLEIMTENLRKHMDAKPQCRFWSVSQNDNASYCTCEKCRARDEAEGTPMGSVLTFVNQIAGRFPDKTISTLAYWYTRKPPKTIRPAPNVHIMLCNIEANRGLPIENDPKSAGSKAELLGWKEICHNISLWDYCIQFTNLVAPFPNLRVIPQNIRFFVENNVKMLFSQSNREYEGEFSALRGYLLAKCMWDPKTDGDAVIREFCEGYYGPAAEPIITYINESTDAMEAAGGELRIFGSPREEQKTWLDEAHFNRYMELAEAALSAAAKDKVRLFRVRTAVMPLWYAGIQLAYGTREEQLDRITQFAEHTKKIGLERVEEWHITPEQFLKEALEALG